MNLRTQGDHRVERHPRPSGLRLLGPCAVLAVLLLACFAGSSGAGVAQYTGTLYLDGGTSSIGSGNYQISTAAGPAQGAAPTLVVGAVGSGGPTGSFVYLYVTSAGGVSTASPISATVSPNNATVTVSGFPAGSDIYRQKTNAGAPNGQAYLVASGASSPYVDTSTAMSGTPLPQSDNRPMQGLAGWVAFAPEGSLGTNLTNSAVSSTTPAPTSCSGWVVDGNGDVTLPAGNWTVQQRVRSGAMVNGVAVLSAGLYVADASGNIVSTVFGPTDGAQQIQNVTNPGIVASVSATTSSATTLATSQHLCVMFWRHQTTAYLTSAANRYVTLVADDPSNQISLHPAPNGFASASLSTPVGGLSTQAVPALGATYTDPDADPGTLTIRLCSDAGCATVLQSSGALAAANGSTQTWTPTGALADNTYYWQAQAKDGLGLASPWTASRSFVLDTVAPVTAITAT